MANTYDIPALLAASVVIDIPVAWGEMDALGHVNNVVFFRYLESSRVAYIRSLGLEDLRASGGVGFILQAAQCRFRAPLFYPDTVRVTARLASIESDRFTLRHEIVSTAQNAVAALGEGTIVTYDYAKGAKVPVPAPVCAAIEASEAARARGAH